MDKIDNSPNWQWLKFIFNSYVRFYSHISVAAVPESCYLYFNELVRSSDFNFY